MKLKTLLGPKEGEIWTSKNKIKNIILRNKFNGLVKGLNLELFEEDGLLIASDDSGQILYKKVNDFEWFQWKPFNFKKAAKDIFDLQ